MSLDTVKPVSLCIEACSICQLSCPTCPTAEEKDPAIGRGFLKTSDLENLLLANRHLRSIEFENRGEFFLNPEVLRILEVGQKHGIPMASNSGVNLNSISDEVLEGIVRSGFRRLLCSIDGASSETYSMYRRGGNFERVIENIRTINKFKKKYQSSFPRLAWQFVVFGHNEHELPQARAFARELEMDFIPKMAWDSSWSPIRNPDWVKQHTGWSAVAREEVGSRQGRHYMRSVCYSLWTSPKINWDGRVLGCCWNSWQDFGSNAFIEGYLPAINSSKLREARHLLRGKHASSANLPCHACPIYQEMQQTHSYLTTREVGFQVWKKKIGRFFFQRFPSLFEGREAIGRFFKIRVL